MRRATIPLLLVVSSLAAACDPSPAPGAGATTTTATEPAATSSNGAGANGLAPLSSNAMADQPMQAPVPTPTVEAEPETITAQHLLVAYKGSKGAAKTITRSKADAKKRCEEALAKAKKGDDFTALVKAYSDEPGAADRLGSLGRFKRGAMVQPFADAAFKLKVGEVSDVVETEFGFHVIKRNQ